MTTRLRVIQPDNHYFEVVQFTTCGHSFRIYTEDIQCGSQTAKARTFRRRRLIERGCPTCKTESQ